MQKTKKIKSNIFKTIFYIAVLIIAFAQNLFSAHYFNHTQNKQKNNHSHSSHSSHSSVSQLIYQDSSDVHHHNSDCIICSFLNAHKDLIINIASSCFLSIALFLILKIFCDHKKPYKLHSNLLPRAPPSNA